MPVGESRAEVEAPSSPYPSIQNPISRQAYRIGVPLSCLPQDRNPLWIRERPDRLPGWAENQCVRAVFGSVAAPVSEPLAESEPVSVAVWGAVVKELCKPRDAALLAVWEAVAELFAVQLSS